MKSPKSSIRRAASVETSVGRIDFVFGEGRTKVGDDSIDVHCGFSLALSYVVEGELAVSITCVFVKIEESVRCIKLYFWPTP